LTESGGRFRVQRDASAIHVIPTQIRNATGEWTPVQSVLDAPISLQKEGNGVELLDAITEAIGKVTGQRVLVGTIPVSLFMHYHGVLNASGSARDALLQLFESTGAKMSWNLLYGPDLKAYALNINVVALPHAQPQIPPQSIAHDPAGVSPAGPTARRAAQPANN